MKQRQFSVINSCWHFAHKVILRVVRCTLQQGAVDINRERCKGCELCVFACPANTLSLSQAVNKRGYRSVEQLAEQHCIGCASCGHVCPDGCITVYRAGILAKAKKAWNTKK